MGRIIITTITKVLSVLVLVQTVLVLLLFIKIDSYEAHLTQAAQTQERVETSAPLAMISPGDGSMVENPGLSGGQLRRIIREELNAVSKNNDVLSANSASDQEDPVVDYAEMQYRLELIDEKFELLKARGEASSSEIESLINEIARLDPESRTAMMKILNGAINRGEIKGHL
jgi:hypothetical protein